MELSFITPSPVVVDSQTEIQLSYTVDTQRSLKLKAHSALFEAHSCKIYQTQKHQWYSNYPGNSALKIGVYTYVNTGAHVSLQCTSR